MEHYKVSVKTPLGIIEIIEYNNKINSVRFKNKNENIYNNTPLLTEAKKQMEAYFKGKLFKFDLPLLFEGTVFQKRVYRSLQMIEYGKTKSYGQIIDPEENAGLGEIENNKSNHYARAVGRAVSKNNIIIIIPCHRVINSNGTLGGFSSGLWRKVYLLNMEKQYFCKI
ncbi:MAG: methylated-DNA--[protein]-cysteine S-methyltransferase [Spirochaetes bacterium]|nr:methylated-DNA--[protein]-cysteine S-methyltransferase [Spirochaetota bacterium]MBN2771192.1 methylated-DNA--[protein]-cysteine S-methyltransferase [Spirochaetota bacterium]